MSVPDITLASGHTIPQFGLGTWTLRGKQCQAVVEEALELGYTHLDSAWMYQNQDAIGRTLKEVGADRGRLFITSKIWYSHLEYEATLGQMEEILRDLQTDYVDLLLIHHPGQGVPVERTLAAFEKIHGPARPAASESATSASSRPTGPGLPPVCRSAPTRWSTTCATTAKSCAATATPAAWS